jgi:hypothetical protein
MKKIVATMFTAAAAAVVMTGCCCQETAPQPLTLAENGATKYTIIYKPSGDLLVDPAVKDLAATLREITGAKFEIAEKADGPKIFIGVTAPGDDAPIASRERRIKSVGDDLYIYGDYRYGTAGAIYNFLREFCGCRWYTATGDKRIPKNPDLKFDAIDYKHIPSFKSLEHGSRWGDAVRNPEIRAWVRRNNSFLMPNYAFGEPDDAWFYIGPVTHTLAAYMPPIIRKPRTFNDDLTFFAGPHPTLAGKAYFKDHPEYFTLDKNGKRVPDRQLCFTNPEVRKELIKNVENAIKGEKYDPATYAILDFTQNDRHGGFCFCKNCRALAEKYQTPGGPYFDFLVEMGKHFEKKYPKLMFRFFSYQEDMTGIPPKGLEFPDNMSVILAPLQQDFSKSFTHKYNVRFLNQMRDWGKLCKEIWIWNYPTLYTHGMNIYSLFPGVYRNTENLKLAHDAGVRYIIAEQGGSVVHGCSFKELNVYLQCLMTEDVNIDVDAAIKEFCDAVYGAASDDMIAYLKETYAESMKDPGYFRYYYDPRVMRRVLHSGRNLIRWQQDFDRMEAKVKGDKKALFNVRRARINLDAVTILCYSACQKFDPTFAEKLPLKKLYQRYSRYVRADAKLQFRSFKNRNAWRGQYDGFMVPVRMAYEFQTRTQSYPDDLVAKYGKENLVTLMPCQSRRPPARWSKRDACGYAVRIPRPDKKTYIVFQHIYVGEKDGLPWNFNEYMQPRAEFLTAEDLKKIDAANDYQLIWIGRDKLTESGVMQLATLPERKGQSGRDARFFLGEFFDEKNPDQEYDFYLSVKRGGRSKDRGLFVDRLVLAKVPAEKK